MKLAIPAELSAVASAIWAKSGEVGKGYLDPGEGSRDGLSTSQILLRYLAKLNLGDLGVVAV